MINLKRCYGITDIRRKKMLSERLIDEFGIILNEEFGLNLEKKRLIRLANFLVSYFQLLLKMNNEIK